MATTTPNVDINTSGDPISGGGSLDFATLVPQILEKFIQVLEGAALIAAGIFLIRYIRRSLQKIELEHAEQRTALNLIEKITSGFIIVISITLALKLIGLDMTLLVGVLVLGLSYGLQDIIKNYVAGILILFKSPFKIGDIVKIRDFTGRVSKMDFQSTTLETFDKRHITIYNSDVMTQTIVNFSKNTLRRLELDVTVGYGSDIEAALGIFSRILEEQSAVLKNPSFSIRFKKFDDTGTTLTLRFWVQLPCNILQVRTQVAEAIHQAFDEQKIMGPYSRGVEGESEAALSVVTNDRAERIKKFYTPILQMPLPSALNLIPALTPVPQVGQMEQTALESLPIQQSTSMLLNITNAENTSSSSTANVSDQVALDFEEPESD